MNLFFPFSFLLHIKTHLFACNAGQVLEVVLAKPQADKKSDGPYPYSTGPHPNHIPHPGYGGFAGNSYGSLGAGYGGGAGFQQVTHWFCICLSVSFVLINSLK